MVLTVSTVLNAWSYCQLLQLADYIFASTIIWTGVPNNLARECVYAVHSAYNQLCHRRHLHVYIWEKETFYFFYFNYRTYWCWLSFLFLVHITRYFLDALSFSSFTNINIVDDKIFKFIGPGTWRNIILIYEVFTHWCTPPNFSSERCNWVSCLLETRF